MTYDFFSVHMLLHLWRISIDFSMYFIGMHAILNTSWCYIFESITVHQKKLSVECNTFSSEIIIFTSIFSILLVSILCNGAGNEILLITFSHRHFKHNDRLIFNCYDALWCHIRSVNLFNFECVTYSKRLIFLCLL